MNSVQTAPTVADDIETAKPAAQGACCAHAQQAHDAIALRYCAATLEAGSSRGCICRSDMT